MQRQLEGSEKKENIVVKTEKHPIISILIPIYNEEEILEESIRDIVGGTDTLGISYELLLCENGSYDRTVEISERLCEEFTQLRLIRYPEPDYGSALAMGIREARGQNIVCFEIDFYDVPFIEIAYVLLKKYDAVIGSKRGIGARDYRPVIRRFITWGFNTFLRIFFKFSGTDTHGIKAFRAERIRPIFDMCKTRRDIYTTELLIRIERAGLWSCEIPLEIRERRPAPINILRRVPSTIKNLWTLWKATRSIGKYKRDLKRVSANGKTVLDDNEIQAAIKLTAEQD